MIRYVKRKAQEFLNDPFWRNVATLFTGTAIAQAMPLLIFPVLTRIYSKEAVGFFFIYAAAGLISQMVASLQYQLAILLPKEKYEADNIFKLSLLTVTGTSVVFLLVVHFLFDFLGGFIVQKDFLKWLYAMPISSFFLGIFKVTNYYLNRLKKYKHISYSRVIKAVVISSLQLTFGFLGYTSFGLIVGLIVGQVVCGVYLFTIVKKNFDGSIFSFNWPALKGVAKKYKEMPLFNTYIAAIGMLSNQLPLFFLSRYFGVGFAGFYGLANRVVSTPMDLLGTSIAQVFTQESSEMANKGKSLHSLVKTTYLRLLKLSSLPFGLLLATSFWLFPLIFGPEYKSSGIMTTIIIPWLFLHFLNSPQSFLFNILKKQRFMAIFHTLFLFTRVVSLFIGYYFFDSVYVSIGFYCLVGILFNLFLMAFYLRITKKPISDKYS